MTGKRASGVTCTISNKADNRRSRELVPADRGRDDGEAEVPHGNGDEAEVPHDDTALEDEDGGWTTVGPRTKQQAAPVRGRRPTFKLGNT